MTDQRPHALYRFYGHDDSLLYVGITMNPGGRWKQHSEDKYWWGEVSNITVTSFSDRPSVLAAEKDAIRTERPRYNVTHNETTSAVTQVAREYVSLACDLCQKSVTSGILFVSSYSLYHAEQDQKAWDVLMERRKEADGHGWCTAEELVKLDSSAPWEVLHHDCCDEDEEAGASYVINVDKRWTSTDLLTWTFHLMEKNWLSATDWPDFCRRALNATALVVVA